MGTFYFSAWQDQIAEHLISQKAIKAKNKT